MQNRSDDALLEPVALRRPEVVMSPERAAAASPTALSFSRSLVRKMLKERWSIRRLNLELDGEGRGNALYQIATTTMNFHFFVVSDVFPTAQKIDRAFGINWDVSAALCEGAWTPEREVRLRQEVPKQYDGRYDADVLCFCRGNRSERIFDHVVDALAAGKQPDTDLLASVGYLLRSTAFAGNGLFGMKPFEGFSPNHPLGAPYHAQILAAYMMRQFVFDLAEQIAAARAPGAVTLDRAIKRYLGLGNSAGLGLVPFIMNHPQIIHQWCLTYEEALAACLGRVPSGAEMGQFTGLLQKAITYFGQDPRDGNGIFADYVLIVDQLDAVLIAMNSVEHSGPERWVDILQRVLPAELHPETVELVNGLLLELYPEIIERYEGRLLGQEEIDLQPEMSVGRLRALLAGSYGWLLEAEGPEQGVEHFWYYPLESPYEPRRGLRGTGSMFEFETAMDMPMLIPALARALEGCETTLPVGNFIAERPEFSAIAARVQSLSSLDYAELRINSLDDSYRPFGACRFLLSFYGMEKFDPRPPRATKGALLQGAPLPDEVAEGIEGDWPFPLIPDQGGARARASEIIPLRLVEQADISVHDIRPVMRRKDNEETVRENVVMFPMEIRKLVSRACLGRGLSFRTAEAASRLTLICEMMGIEGFDALLEALETCVGGLPGKSYDGAVVGRGIPDFAATAVLDLAGARAFSQHSGVGVAIGRDVQPTPLIRGLATWGAQRGLFCGVADLANREMTVAGADHGSVWVVRLLDFVPEWAVVAASSERASIPTGMAAEHQIWWPWLAAAPDSAHGYVKDDGFAVMCAKHPPVQARALEEISTCADMMGLKTVLLTVDALEKARRAIDRVGITLSEAQFDRLSILAKKALVPEDIEKSIVL